MPITPAIAFNTLLANPGAFLKRYPVRIFGATAASGVAGYTMLNRNPGASMRPGSVLGTLNMHTTESFEIRSNAALGAVGGGAGGHAFQAHSIHMDAGTTNMGFYRLGAGAGPTIVVTGQLSGCSFVMLPVAAGVVDVAHVRPQGQTGQALQAALATAMPNAQIYGASGASGNYDSADRFASIIGVRFAGVWRIYAQKQDANAGDFRIKSAYQIYPNRQKL